ncbi:unnamed protein product, partial [Porites lobata]
MDTEDLAPLRTQSARVIYVPKNLVAKILAHVEHGHRGPGSIKNPVCEGYVPKNLVAKILAHVEHGHRGPGSI